MSMPGRSDERDVRSSHHDEAVPPEPSRSVFLASVVLTVVPIAVAAALAVHRHWIPVGDNAYFAIRARDVLSAHPPLLGTWTSASLHARSTFNNPGPLLFDLLALPTRLWSGPGLAVGVAILNGAAVVGIATFALRCGGRLVGTIAMVVTSILCWAMGSAVLLDPTQPSSLLLPLLLFMFLVVSALCGDDAAIPFLAAVGSLLLQSYITYVYLVLALGVWTVVVVSVRARARRRASVSDVAVRHRVRSVAVVTGVVLLVCWIQPLVEQLRNWGQGNVARIVRSVGDPSLDPIGYRTGTRIMAQVMTAWPSWFRPSFREFLRTVSIGAPSLLFAVATLAFVLVILVIAAWRAQRRNDEFSQFACSTAVVGVLAGVVTAGRMPLSAFGPSAHVFRWLWSLSAFVAFALLVFVLRAFERDRARAVLAVGLLLVVAAFAIMNLPSNDQGAAADESGIPVMRDLGRQIDHGRVRGPLLVDLRRSPFGDPYGPAILAQLQRSAIPFVTTDLGVLHQLGSFRRFTGRNARSALLIRRGDATSVPPQDATRLAYHPGLDAAEQRELAAVEARIRRHIRREGLRLDRRGRAAVRSRQISSASLGDAAALFSSRQLVDLVHRHYLDLDARSQRLFRRYAELQAQWDEQTIAVFIGRI